MLSSKVSSIYIHIPFCKSKCHYCNFLSFTDKFSHDEYIKALCKQIKEELKPETSIKTIYIGGGTPSVLDIEHFCSIFNTIKSIVKVDIDAEITVEVNPATVDYEYLKNLRKIGTNRLSIGVQSFNNKFLKALNRLHTKQDAIFTVVEAKKAGFENISIDLIYGLPSQTLKDWETDLQEACNLDIQHISAYGLKIEDGTFFGKNKPKNIPDDEECSKIFLQTGKLLEEKDFKRYEISNYSKGKYQSQHNITYWENKEYYGFGLGAHGYVHSKRYANTSDYDRYIVEPTFKRSVEELSVQDKLEEEIFLGLRLTKGIDISLLSEKYGIDFLEKYGSILDKHLSNKLMILEDSVLKLTNEGVLLSNFVLADFLE